ncbi:hypothetical protein ABZ883_40500 [Streptomyces sp. NPDC046977]|uniref:hypothetical protein n=1 Tax=Streptomyces sp. NPDC046977 TaxID=3154703 RepID=UPI00340443B4
MTPALALAERPTVTPPPAVPVLVSLSATRTAPDPDAVELVGDVEALFASSLPGCGNDNPYQ